jgi:hypothetical protein
LYLYLLDPNIFIACSQISTALYREKSALFSARRAPDASPTPRLAFAIKSQLFRRKSLSAAANAFDFDAKSSA